MFIVASVLGLATLVCFIMVLIQMFTHGKVGLGILSIVLLPCCGIGGLIVFITGWMNATPWGIKNLMIVYTVLIILYVLMSAVAGPPIDVNALQQQLQQMQTAK
jgi:hypothetical protein